jgi:Leucine-rich repeat (LRR) protein
LTGLQWLICDANQLTALDVSALKQLRSLECYNNQLTALDVSGLKQLQALKCYNNQLTALDVSGLTNLQGLDCSYNNMTSTADVTGWIGGEGWMFDPQHSATSPALTLSESTLNMSGGGMNSIRVVSNIDWTAVSDAAWLTVSPASGSNSGTLTVTAEANTVNSVRIATVTVSGNGITRTITVAQLAVAPPVLTVPVDRLSFETAGGMQTVFVSCNTTWTAVSDAEWFSVSPASGRSNGELIVIVGANPGYARTETVRITAGGLVRTIAVTQAAAQQVIVEPEPPVDNHGAIEVSLEIPVNELFSITFTLRLPAGFILDPDATALVSELLSGYQLVITPTGDGGWRFEIKPQAGLRSGDATAFQKVINIAYTINPESVPAGDYAVKITDVDLTLNSGETVHQDEISVPVHVTPAGNEAVDAAKITCVGALLTVNTPAAEQINVYSLSGARIYSVQKDAGAATFRLSGLPDGVYIVTGSSGWSKKVITN